MSGPIRKIVTPTAYVLDDDRIFLTLVTKVLKRFGIASETFQTSAELKARLKEKLPTLCIVDLSVEGANSSLELIRYIRAEFPSRLPVIVSSGTMAPAAISEAIESGASDYLTKPLEREVLVSKLIRYTASQELQNATHSFPPTPDVEFKVSGELDVNLLEVDELGMKISSRSLIGKGCAIPLSGRILTEITGDTAPTLMTVISSELIAQKNVQDNLYVMYLEFDSSNQKLLSQVRTWLNRAVA